MYFGIRLVWRKNKNFVVNSGQSLMGGVRINEQKHHSASNNTTIVSFNLWLPNRKMDRHGYLAGTLECSRVALFREKDSTSTVVL